MTDYTNWKIEKSVINYTGQDEEKQKAAQAAQDEYTAVAEWCNETGQYTIEDDGTYYKVVAIPEPTPEEKAALIRAKRDSYLEQYVDPLVANPLRWADLTEQEQQEVKDYRQYLLNIPQQPEFPDIEVLTFEEWKHDGNSAE